MQITKKVFFHSDLLKLCNRKKRKITEFFPDTTVFTNKKRALRTNEMTRWSAINQSYRIIHTFGLRRTLPKYLRTFLHKNTVLMICLTEEAYYSICIIIGQTFHPYSTVIQKRLFTFRLMDDQKGQIYPLLG